MAMVWYGDAVQTRIRKHLVARVEYAARSFRDYLRVKLSTPGPEPSQPGEYPHKQIGHLRRTVQMEMDRMRPLLARARVGTNTKYARYLETGTRRMAARPWLSRGMREFAPTIRRILEAEVPGG